MSAFGKLVMLKTAWCDLYDGDETRGNFGYVEEHGPNSGHERFNFRRAADGLYRGYVPPIGKHRSPPSPDEPDHWTVVWVAKRPGSPGVRVVGAYFDASFLQTTDSYQVAGNAIEYCVTAKDALLVRPEFRTKSFRSPIKSGPCCYLRGGKNDEKYRELARELEAEILHLRAQATADAGEEAMAGRFPSPEHIRRVEEAAVKFVWRHFEARGYELHDRQKDNVGYDLEAVSGQEHLLLEVKGSSGSVPYAYLTANEWSTAQARAAVWRLCMVTSALTSPRLTTFDKLEVERSFDLEPMTYRAVLKESER